MATALIAALFAGIVTAVQLLKLHLPDGVEPEPRMLVEPPPVATVVAVGLVGSVSILQLTVARGVLDALERDRARIADGQVWRLVSALVVQDGGIVGTVSNLAFLAVLGVLAERVLGRRRAIIGWWAGALAGELVGLAWQPVGAGNSVGNLGLVGALAAAGLAARRRPPVLIAMLVVILVSDVALLAGSDIHGAALTAGIAVSFIVSAGSARS